MGHIPLLEELAIIAGLGVVVTALLSRLHLPTVAGLLMAGALMGPYGWGVVSNLRAIEALAEVGVVLLLFTIGLEFSLDRMRYIFRRAALGGFLQVAMTVAVTAAIAMWQGQSPSRSIFYGFIFAMSSTAIVLRALTDRRELDAPHGRFIVGALIFQDLCIVPMGLLIPVLGSDQPIGGIISDIGFALGKASLVVAGTLLVARLLVPRLLRWVDASRSREVFLLAILAICVGTAWLTSLTGLSLALGAFLGGMVVADTEFQHRAMGEMIPLRDTFVSVFFISLGMLFNVYVVLDRPLAIVLLLIGFMIGKGLLATIAAVVMRFPARVAWLAGVGLAQFGEFGFVLLKIGESTGLADRTIDKALLSAGILSMFVTTMLIRLAPHITAGERLLTPLTRVLGVRGIDELDHQEQLKNHVIVIGYGIAGKLVGRALNSCAVPHLVLELNAETVRRARETQEPVYYADATSVEALEHAHIYEARMVVVLINDPQAAVRVVDTIRRVAPKIPVIVRIHYYAERSNLMALGAADVVIEEVEAGITVLDRVLQRLEISDEAKQSFINNARRDMSI